MTPHLKSPLILVLTSCLALLSLSPASASDTRIEGADLSLEEFHQVQQFIVVESTVTPDPAPSRTKVIAITLKPGPWFQSEAAKDSAFDSRFIKLEARMSKGKELLVRSPIDLSPEGPNLKGSYRTSSKTSPALSLVVIVSTSKTSSTTLVLPSEILTK